MVSENRQTLESILRRRFARFVSHQKKVGTALPRLVKIVRERGWTTFAFGGTPRGVYDNGKNYRPRDLDLVFDDSDFHFFESTFERHILRRNRFGGLHIKFDGLIVDAWPLSSTWAFAHGLTQKTDFENLPQTTFLNIDGIIIELAPKTGKSRKIFDCGFFSGWQSKTLNINLEDNPFPALCVVRTLRIAKIFGFKLSHRLTEYLWNTLTERSYGEFEKAQLSHYHRIDFNRLELIDVAHKAYKHLHQGNQLPLNLFSLRPDQLELPFLANQKKHARPSVNSSEMESKQCSLTFASSYRDQPCDGLANYLFTCK